MNEIFDNRHSLVRHIVPRVFREPEAEKMPQFVALALRHYALRKRDVVGIGGGLAGFCVAVNITQVIIHRIAKQR